MNLAALLLRYVFRCTGDRCWQTGRTVARWVFKPVPRCVSRMSRVRVESVSLPLFAPLAQPEPSLTTTCLTHTIDSRAVWTPASAFCLHAENRSGPGRVDSVEKTDRWPSKLRCHFVSIRVGLPNNLHGGSILFPRPNTVELSTIFPVKTRRESGTVTDSIRDKLQGKDSLCRNRWVIKSKGFMLRKVGVLNTGF